MWESAAGAEPGSTMALATSSQTRVSLSEEFVSEAPTSTPADSNAQHSGAERQGFSFSASQSTAVLKASAADRDRVGELLKTLGYGPVCWEVSEDLLVSQKNSVRSDLAVPGPAGDESRLSHGKRESPSSGGKGVPLLIVRRVQSSVGEINTDMADADFVRASCTASDVEARLAELRTSEPWGGQHEGFQCGHYHFVPNSHTVYFRGKKVKLQKLEFDLARQFFLSPGSIHLRETLLRSVWGHIVFGRQARKLDVHVSNLRKKLDLETHRGYELAVVRGVGYQLKVRSSKGSPTWP